MSKAARRRWEREAAIRRKARGCTAHLGENRETRPKTVFCGRPTVGSSPYCEAHGGRHSDRDPGQEGILAARADAARARERAPGATTNAARSEKRTKAAASGSANALNRALGYLEAALTELHEARARIEADPILAMDAPEGFLVEAVETALRQTGLGGTESIRELRDRRATRAGFSFDEED